MRIQSLANEPKISTGNPNFKSVYPVYHWYNPNKKFSPVTDIGTIRHCQRLLVGMINSTTPKLYRKDSSFLQQVINYIAVNDKDFLAVPYVRSFYNAKGGFKRDAKGNIYKVEPLAYIITGNDAVNFENVYGKPINTIAKEVNGSEREIQAAVQRAKCAFSYNGLKYMRERSLKFVDKESKKPLELHTIFCKVGDNNSPKLIKLSFFESGAKNNPFVKNGYIR